jgi:ribokinase
LEIPLATVIAAVRLAGQLNKPVILNPAPTPAEFPAELFEVDLICPNQTEAAALL